MKKQHMIKSRELAMKMWSTLSNSRTVAVMVSAAIAVSAMSVLAAEKNHAADAATTFERFDEASEQFQFLSDNCLDCHNYEDWAGGVAFDVIEPKDLTADPKLWEKVITKLQGRMMPPSGFARVDPVASDQFIDWVEDYLDHAYTLSPHVGRVGIHRINRKEYGNAVKDLFNIEVDASNLLPTDASVEGFDNIAEALRASPSFLDQSLTAARVVVSQAVGNPEPRAGGATYRASGNQHEHLDGLPLGTRGGLQVEHYFPADGEYVLNIGNLASALWVTNQEFTHTLIATLDGKKFFELDIGGGEDLKAIDQIGDPAVDEINSRLKDIRFNATAGPHKLAVTFVHRSFAEFEGNLHVIGPNDGLNVIGLNTVELLGPYNPEGLSPTPARQLVFSACYPQSETEQASCAKKIIASYARRAYRGFQTPADVEKLMGIYSSVSKTQGFEMGVRHALTAIIASPKFLYRIESTPKDAAPGSIHRLSDLELASRLSFFLWSSIPDETLLDLAEAGKLHQPEVLQQQVLRLLQDPRANSLSSNFANQWLRLAKMDEVDPDPDIFRGIDFGIRPLMKEEVDLFTRDIFLNNKPINELLTADFTYMNERLANHYNISEVKGDQFRKVTLEDYPERKGLLGKGAILMASSYPDRTSPVLRGNYVLEFILGTPPPLPPPNVEALIANKPGARQMSIKERLEVHRTDPNCNGCHGFIDPLGFALENFDSVGRFRTIDIVTDTPVDTDGILPEGKPIHGVGELRAAILERPQLLAENLTHAMLMYALGRPVEAHDMPVVRKIVEDAAKNDYRFYDIVMGVVNSDQFQLVEVVSDQSEGHSVAQAN